MVFNNKGSFFLDLGSEGAKPATVAIAPEKPAAKQEAAATKPAAAKPAAAKPVAVSAAAPAQEAKPAATMATFAPECLNPANAVPTRRRRAGANLAGFKTMAAGLFRS